MPELQMVQQRQMCETHTLYHIYPHGAMDMAEHQQLVSLMKDTSLPIVVLFSPFYISGSFQNLKTGEYYSRKQQNDKERKKLICNHIISFNFLARVDLNFHHNYHKRRQRFWNRDLSIFLGYRPPNKIPSSKNLYVWRLLCFPKRTTSSPAISSGYDLFPSQSRWKTPQTRLSDRGAGVGWPGAPEPLSSEGIRHLLFSGSETNSPVLPQTLPFPFCFHIS